MTTRSPIAGVRRFAQLASGPIAGPSRSPALSPSRMSVRHSSALASTLYTTDSSEDAEAMPSSTETTPASLSPADRDGLHRMLRVDHSGEIAANTIYIAQARVFAALGDKRTSQMCMDMLETEKKHLGVTVKLLQQHRVRPSMLNPVWGLAGTVLGGATALLGKEGAMAATEAVETVIGEHYDDQIVLLDQITQRTAVPTTLDAATTEVGDGTPHPSLELLSRVIREFRDDELEHLDTAVEHDAQQAPGHALLSAIIGLGCKGAIQIAKRF